MKYQREFLSPGRASRGGVCAKAMAGSLEDKSAEGSGRCELHPYRRYLRKHQFCNAHGQLPEVHVSLYDYIQSEDCAELTRLNPDDKNRADATRAPQVNGRVVICDT